MPTSASRPPASETVASRTSSFLRASGARTSSLPCGGGRKLSPPWSRAGDRHV
ncbi:hypothetical protein ACF09C_02070 [Streptomyces sp. NPDC014870]|uniref:hypothetical protein n=1 Tax=Streptomyces sp. NPDC014870 TaxID=3364925 RepID=UPI003701DA65